MFQVRCALNGEVYAMKVVDKASVERCPLDGQRQINGLLTLT